LKEGSDKELAGVVAAFFTQPVDGLEQKVLDGKFLEADPAVTVRVWKPDAPADEQFADVALGPDESDEAGHFMSASKGSKLNLSEAEIGQFSGLNDPGAVNAQLRAMLKARYLAYRRDGLNGIAPYARGGRKVVAPPEEIILAIHEAMPGEHLPDYRKALLNYPGDAIPEMEHRFYWWKKQVEGRPTFVLAHRASARLKNAAVLTEEQYYVGHSYNCNFVIAGGVTVEGGTLVFCMNRTFTDQVAGFASGMRHSIGRGQMLSAVAATLKSVRDQSSK
jgi:hypothetical protein